MDKCAQELVASWIDPAKWDRYPQDLRQQTQSWVSGVAGEIENRDPEPQNGRTVVSRLGAGEIKPDCVLNSKQHRRRRARIAREPS
jgi:hypothetical protein